MKYYCTIKPHHLWSLNLRYLQNRFRKTILSFFSVGLTRVCPPPPLPPQTIVVCTSIGFCILYFSVNRHCLAEQFPTNYGNSLAGKLSTRNSGKCSSHTLRRSSTSAGRVRGRAVRWHFSTSASDGPRCHCVRARGPALRSST